jgi:hypothetical protein
MTISHAQCEHFILVEISKKLHFLLMLTPPINPIIFNPHSAQVESACDIALKKLKKARTQALCSPLTLI